MDISMEMKKPKEGTSVWGSFLLVLLLIFYETLFTFLGMGINTVFQKTMGISMGEDALSSIFQVFAYFFFLKKVVIKRSYPLKVKGRWDGLDVGLLAVLLLGYIFIYDNTLGQVVSKTFEEKDVIETLNNLVNSKWIGFMALLVVAPIFEEIICRGVILEQLMRRYGATIAVLVSSFIFGAIHLNFNQGVNAFFIGVIFGITYVKTQSLIPSIILHFLNNGFFYALSFAGDGFLDAPVWVFVVGGAVLVIIGLGGFLLRKKWEEREQNEDSEQTISASAAAEWSVAGPIAAEMSTTEPVEAGRGTFRILLERFLNLRVFGKELFSYGVFWRIVFATLLLSITGNLLNGFVKLGNNMMGICLLPMLILGTLSYDWIGERLGLSKYNVRYFVYIFMMIVGGALITYTGKGLLMQMWRPIFEAAALIIFGIVGMLWTGRMAEREARREREEKRRLEALLAEQLQKEVEARENGVI